MKTLIIILMLLLTAQLKAQNNDLSLLTAYLDIKDALISNNVKEASDAAIAWTNAIVNVKAIDKNEITSTWHQQKDNLLKYGAIISNGKDIEKQRAAFAELSVAYWPIVKLSTTGETLYYDYCPMKKSYWISAEEGIKNPYYGSKMLSCGKTVEQNN